MNRQKNRSRRGKRMICPKMRRWKMRIRCTLTWVMNIWERKAKYVSKGNAWPKRAFIPGSACATNKERKNIQSIR